MIFGIPGSGKSTFAVEISDRLKLPVYHLDRFFFIENWQERDPEEFLHIQKKLVDLEAWIIDGNSVGSLEMRYSKADAVLYFKFNRLLCLWRIFKRFFSKDPRISDRADGCSEKVRWHLIRYLWGFDRRNALKIRALREKYPEAVFFEFHSGRDVENFIEKFTTF